MVEVSLVLAVHANSLTHPPCWLSAGPDGGGATPSSKKSSGGGGSGGGGGKCKRVRTIFTADQLERLEAEFERQQYMVGPERLYLAHALSLTEAQVHPTYFFFKREIVVVSII